MDCVHGLKVGSGPLFSEMKLVKIERSLNGLADSLAQFKISHNDTRN